MIFNPADLILALSIGYLAWRKSKCLTLSLPERVFAGMLLGIGTGLEIHLRGSALSDAKIAINFYLVNGLFDIGGQVFKNSFQMLVVPLVYISLVNGTAGMGKVVRLGRIGLKTFIFYISTTALAISLALALSLLIGPGRGIDRERASIEALKSNVTIASKKPLKQILIDIVPKNPIKSMADAEMLQVIFLALLTGVSLSLMGDKARFLCELFSHLDRLTLKIVELVMLFAPYGVFFLVARTFSSMGFDGMVLLGRYMFTVLGALLLHTVVVYGSILKAMGGLSPLKFVRKFSSVMVFAFSSSSSNATIPVTVEAMGKKIGVAESVSSFTIPLGATVNMDGTAIMQGVAVLFVSQFRDIPLDLSQLLTVILTATIASVGTAGVPGVGLITLSMVLSSVGLPVDDIALIMGVDRILDMCRTVVNVTGDAVCTAVIARSENAFDKSVFESVI
ncbi:MAG: dicarboxylate/amino acid:cation symporter [Candidatus Wallbacteria bacterium]|nr:dicarboxylate/amino acid:cation symporter [Candidatus Wallbacteria bacterium]